MPALLGTTRWACWQAWPRQSKRDAKAERGGAQTMRAMRQFHWAVVGPARIAQRFAQALQGLPDARLFAVCAREEAKGHSFAWQWARAGEAPPLVFTDVAALLAQVELDAVYVATPHAQHADVVAACLHAGIAVLCEKPLVPHLAAAQPLMALSQARGVFLMEALWTRFLPAYAQVAQWLQDQAIGPIRGLQSSFCFASPYDANSRLFHPALAGGALLDIGVYNLSMTRWVLQQAWGLAPGQGPVALQIQAQGQLAPTGVDQRVAGSLLFEGGVVSQFVCAFDAQADNSLRIIGERGHIELPQMFWQATQAVLQRHGQAAEVVDAPFRINGFEGEIEESMRCVRAGLSQSPVMPHAETLATLAWMDQMRQQLGVRYPFE
jgi:predicted dehydrogenase